MTDEERFKDFNAEKDSREIMEEALKRINNTDPADHKRTEEIITQLYKDNKVDMPKDFYFKWVDSPEAAIKYLREITKPEKYNFDTFMFGSLEGPWLEFYDHFRKKYDVTYGKEADDLLDKWLELSSICGWWFPYDKLCVCVEKPSLVKGTITTLNDNVLTITFHNENERSVKWKDNTGIACLSNIYLPPDKEMYALSKPEELNAQMVVKETNAELRRELVKRIGIERIAKELNAAVLDEADGYKLLNVKFNKNDRTNRPYLLMINPSTGTEHLEGVHPDCKTVAEAIKWRNGGNTEKPIQLT